MPRFLHSPAAIVLVLGLSSSSCKQEPAPSSTAAKPSLASKVTVATGLQSDGSIVSAVDWFHGSLDEAFAQAKADGKLVFLNVGAYWCPPCHSMNEKVFTQRALAKSLAARYVMVHIDAEKENGPELVERYNIQAYPTFVVLEASGVEKGRLVDFTSAENLLASLEKITKGGNVLATLEAEVNADPSDLAKVYKLGHAYALSADKDRANIHFDAVLSQDPKNETGLAAKALYDRASYVTAKLDGDPEKAITELKSLQKRFPGTDKAIRAYRMMGRLYSKLGQEEEAVASLRQMIAVDPEEANWYANFGWFSFRQKVRPQEALAALAVGMQKHPDNAELRYLEGELNHQLGQDKEALTAMQKAAALQPKTTYYTRRAREFAAEGTE